MLTKNLVISNYYLWHLVYIVKLNGFVHSVIREMARVALKRREQVYERQSKYRQQRSVRIQGGALLKDAAIHNNIGECKDVCTSL